MRSLLRPAIVSLLALSLLTGVVYPMIVTGLGHLLFPRQAEGSLIVRGGKVVGSALIGQAFEGPEYFWTRPSATGAVPYDGGASSGSNLGPANPALLDAVRRRVAALHAADAGDSSPVPVDLVTASASGLDPHISPAAARYQIGRVSRARHLDAARVAALVARTTEPRTWGVLGEPRVNALLLNLALDSITPVRVIFRRSHARPTP
jgi:K+-transporting ATPase ATPase C chain